MNERQRDLIVEALQMWVNLIDTGSPHLTEFEAHRQGRDLPVKTKEDVELIVELSNLSARFERWAPKPKLRVVGASEEARE